MIVSLKKIDVKKKMGWKNNLRGDGDENIFTYFKSFFYFIDRFVIYGFSLYLYACGISYYPIMSLIFKLYFFISICYSLVRYLYFTFVVDVSEFVKHCFKHGKIHSPT